MNKKVKTGLYVLLGVLVLLFILSFLLPGSVSYKQSVTVKTTMNCAFNIVHNLLDWEQWDEWRRDDPGAKLSYSNPASGQGAFCMWENSKGLSPEGQITLTEVIPGIRISAEIEAKDKPRGTYLFEFSQNGASLDISTHFEYHYGNNPVTKYKLFFGKARIQRLLNQSLQNMKEYCESR